jgi:hypothetical protein
MSTLLERAERIPDPDDLPPLENGDRLDRRRTAARKTEVFALVPFRGWLWASCRPIEMGWRLLVQPTNLLPAEQWTGAWQGCWG